MLADVSTERPLNVFLKVFPGICLPSVLQILQPSLTTIGELHTAVISRLPATVQGNGVYLTTTANRRLDPRECETVATLCDGSDILPLRLQAPLKGGSGHPRRPDSGHSSSYYQQATGNEDPEEPAMRQPQPEARYESSYGGSSGGSTATGHTADPESESFPSPPPRPDPTRLHGFPYIPAPQHSPSAAGPSHSGAGSSSHAPSSSSGHTASSSSYMGTHPATNPEAYGQHHTGNQYMGAHPQENPEAYGEYHTGHLPIQHPEEPGEEEEGEQEPESFYDEHPEGGHPGSGAYLAGEDEDEEEE
ncbi:hypothetical protein LTR10_017106 [Elasticomyces elasticus]|nr:hypothetical protein LTR10_017106 [Elasticomyces elasticus]KAK5037223.1 hypothetical protein LTR13_005029 [Exophiala sideris]KAK5182381.1 hypothetical protein LTR44_005393 [Eurotiomycetes sp. CCFEE 6388]